MGSGAIALKKALMIAGICELLGAVTLGRGVSSKLQESVSDVTTDSCWACSYCDSRISQYQMGMFSSLISCGFFLMLACVYKMPVSTTHSIVGAIIGMTIIGG